MKFEVGPTVKRPDGRFYVPVTVDPAFWTGSATVLRVASDAFPSLKHAEAFAQFAARALNGAV
jgi:hypothetical protein